MCQEVLQLLKNVVGMEAFTKEYAASFKQLGDRREARKEQRAAEVNNSLGFGFTVLLFLLP